MIATVFALLAAIFLVQYPLPEGTGIPAVLPIGMIIVAILFLIALPAVLALSWLPLQKAEQNTTPRILEIFRKDVYARCMVIWLMIFPLATFVLSIDALYIHLFNRMWVFAGWLILLGLSIDFLHNFVKRIFEYLNPFAAIELFAKMGKEAIQNGKEADLCHWIDGLSEIAIKAIQRHSTSLAHASLNEQQALARLFFQSSKSISHHIPDQQSQEHGVVDTVSYTMYYLYQRLDLEFDKSIKNEIEPTCSLIIIILGKIAVDAAKYDISMASPPLRFLGKLAKKAQEHGFADTVIKASCTLLEVSKVILHDLDITYLEIKEPFLSIVNTLEELAQGAFRRDRSANIALLIQPFLDLKKIFSEEKIKTHQDAPVIIQNIDRVLGEFEALQVVLNTLPTIPKFDEQGNPIPPKEETQAKS